MGSTNHLTEMVNRGINKCLGDWLDNDDVCKRLSISPRTLQTLRDRSTCGRLQGKNGTLAYSQIERKIYYKVEDVDSILHLVEDRKKDAYWREQDKKKRQGKQ